MNTLLTILGVITTITLTALHIINLRKKKEKKERYFPKSKPKPKLWQFDGEKCCGNCNDYAGKNDNAPPLPKAYCLERAIVVKDNNVCINFQW